MTWTIQRQKIKKEGRYPGCWRLLSQKLHSDTTFRFVIVAAGRAANPVPGLDDAVES